MLQIEMKLTTICLYTGNQCWVDKSHHVIDGETQGIIFSHPKRLFGKG